MNPIVVKLVIVMQKGFHGMQLKQIIQSIQAWRHTHVATTRAALRRYRCSRQEVDDDDADDNVGRVLQHDAADTADTVSNGCSHHHNAAAHNTID